MRLHALVFQQDSFAPCHVLLSLSSLLPLLYSPQRCTLTCAQNESPGGKSQMHRWHKIKLKIKLKENKLRKFGEVQHLFPTAHRVIYSRCLQPSVKLDSATVLISLPESDPPTFPHLF